MYLNLIELRIHFLAPFVSVSRFTDPEIGEMCNLQHTTHIHNKRRTTESKGG